MPTDDGYSEWYKDNQPCVTFTLLKALMQLDVDLHNDADDSLHGMLGDALDDAGKAAWQAATARERERRAREVHACPECGHAYTVFVATTIRGQK